jgi:dihydroorotate dehydrogenase (fumarate)
MTTRLQGLCRRCDPLYVAGATNPAEAEDLMAQARAQIIEKYGQYEELATRHPDRFRLAPRRPQGGPEMDLTTSYMGLMLRSPLIASASPLNADLGNIRALEDAGAGAVVLPSIFAEQIEAEAHRHDPLTRADSFNSPEAAGYFPAADLYNVASDRYLDLVRRARAAVSIPIIASLNAAHEESWTEYATQLQEAGASALELNIYFVPADISLSGRDVERRYLDIVGAVKGRVTMPVSVKIAPYFSSIAYMAMELAAAGADALVLFNRFYQPDIDIIGMKISQDLELSRSADMRLPLLWIGVLHGRVRASLAATTGVHTADDAVKYLLAGADAVMTTSALLQYGVGYMRALVDGLAAWLEVRNITSVSQIQGILSQGRISTPEDYERANYIKILQGYEKR